MRSEGPPAPKKGLRLVAGEEQAQHYTFSSNSRDPQATAEKRPANPNFQKTRTRLANSFRAPGDSLCEPGDRLEVPRRAPPQQTASLSHSGRDFGPGRPRVTAEPAPDGEAGPPEPGGARREWMLVPRHLLERSGWSLFLSQSCRHLGRKDG